MVANRTLDRAKELARDFRMLGKIHACQFQELGGQHFDLVINATSAGLKGEMPPFPASILGRRRSATTCLRHAGHALRCLGQDERRGTGGPGLGHAGGAGRGVVLRLARRAARHPAVIARLPAPPAPPTPCRKGWRRSAFRRSYLPHRHEFFGGGGMDRHRVVEVALRRAHADRHRKACSISSAPGPMMWQPAPCPPDRR